MESNCFRDASGGRGNQEVPPEKVCTLPIMHRTTEDQSTFQDFVDKYCATNNPVYLCGMEPFLVSIHEVTRFIKYCKELEVQDF